MSLAHLTSGFVLGLSSGIAPGPLLTLVVAQSLSFGVAEGAKVALAPLVTDAPIIAVAFLLGTQLAAAPMPLGILSMAGAVYIGYLAWSSMTVRPMAQVGRIRSPHSLKRGIWTNFLNPHPYLFWITFGTPVLHKLWSMSPGAALFWLASFYTMLVGTKLLLAVLVGHWRKLLQGKSYVWANRLLGAAMLFFAVILARDGLHLLWG